MAFSRRSPLLDRLDETLSRWDRANQTIPPMQPNVLLASPDVIDELKLILGHESMRAVVEDDVYQSAPRVYGLALREVTNMGRDYLDVTRED